jgi:hypothetical protein
MPYEEYHAALQWLTKRIIEDPRFVISTVYTMYTGLTGKQPLTPPNDDKDPEFDAKLAAFEAQDAEFQKIGEAFAGDNMNLKTAIKGVVKSPYFRATNSAKVGDEREAQLAEMGPARLLTPELLDMKIKAVSGISWARSWDSSPYLRTNSEYQLFYGGIDSDSVITRITSPNGIMANIARRMANEIGCRATPRDFYLPASDRKLFPFVDPGFAPEDENGFPIDGAIEAIKQNIQHLHKHILGEDLDIDDPEIDHTYELFLDTFREGQLAVSNGEESTWMPWTCQVRVDPVWGTDLADEYQLRQDPNYGIRAWMAVVTYLMSDFRFIYH